MKTKNGVLGFDLNLYPSDDVVAGLETESDWDRLHAHLSDRVERALRDGLGAWFGEWEVAKP